MKSNPNEFEPYGKDFDKDFSSPVSVFRVSSNARTLPSSNGSCGSVSSGSFSIVAPPPIDNNQEQSDDTVTSSVEPSKCAVSKVILMITAFLLLFGAGLMGGFLATGASSRNATVPSSNNEGSDSGNHHTVDGSFPSASPSSFTIVTFDNPTASPSTISGEQPSPTDLPTPTTHSPSESPTDITADVTRVPIPSPTSQLSPDGSFNYRANNEFLVGVYYYPWYGKNFHNGGGYMRKEIVPRQYPSLGEYDDTDPNVIAEHMKMFRRANIGLLVTSWWGPDRLEDSTTKDVIMTHKDVGNLKVALLYETTNRLKNGMENITNAKTDIIYMCEHYFNHPNYYNVDGRPVIFIYLARTLESRGVLEESLLTMRSEAAKCGHNIFLVGDYVFGSSPIITEEEPYFPFWYFDAVTNYDVYGSAGRPAGHAGHEAVSLYYENQARWKEETAKENCWFIPAVSPGYNDRGVRLESNHPALSRRLTENTEEGSLFHFQLKHAKKLADPQMEKLILVNSFNEWHEDTQIEPVASVENAIWPPLMTQDLEYVGYGNLYLDILGASTVSEHGQGIFDYLYEY